MSIRKKWIKKISFYEQDIICGDFYVNLKRLIMLNIEFNNHNIICR